MPQEADTSNYVYLAMTAHFWGSGNSESSALRQCREAGGRRMVERHGYVLFRTHPDFEVSNLNGDVYTPKGHPLIEVKRKTKGDAWR